MNKRKEKRKAEANVRQKAYDDLTIEQKLAKLPPEPHAQKQRTKLLAQLENKNKPIEKIAEEPQAPLEEEIEQTHEHLKAKERRSKEKRNN